MSQPPKKSTKVRKPQTEEEYQIQRSQYYAEGPFLNTENWLYEEIENHPLDENRKSDRVVVIHACEKAYFNRDYHKCLELISAGETLFGVDGTTVSRAQKQSEYEAAGIKVAKSAKIEKHILELLSIKERCLQKINQAES
ncbi:hypothetical protein CAAN1_18S00276 [[Candida] anglica]|uniref:Uncharacterized protein n=1 Tax=[Candida] anglica TaxID=148631 RepID=A0ABP0ELR8_9ASCO